MTPKALAPAPWRFELGIRGYHVLDDKGVTICTTRHQEVARYIAGAPAAYAALNQLLHATMFKDHPEASQCAIDALRAVGEM